MKTLALLLCLVPAIALGQSHSNTAGGVSASCPSCALIDATLTLSGVFTSTVASGSDAIVLAAGAKINFGNSAHLWANGSTSLTTDSSITTSGQNITAGAGVITNSVSARSNLPVTIYGLANDGASAVGVILGPSTALTTTGAKIAQFCNANSFGTCSTEKASIDKDGNARLNHVSCTMSSATTCTATVPTGSVCECQATAGTASTLSCAVSSTTATCTASASNSNTWNVFLW